MKTDRELLELAAKAAGITLSPMEISNVEFKGDNHFIGFLADVGQCPRGWFNPLTDDGDALRLAVKLNLLYGKVFARSVAESHEDGDDVYAATRRAIVRAAAAIGEAMQ